MVERRGRRTKRMNEEPKWRNQFMSASLPTLAYVPHVQLDEKSRYQMAIPSDREERYEQPLR